MGFKILNKVICQKKIPEITIFSQMKPNEKIVFLYLCHNAYDDTAECYHGETRIAKTLGMQKASVSRAIKALVQKGLIHKGPHKHTSSWGHKYRISNDIYPIPVQQQDVVEKTGGILGTPPSQVPDTPLELPSDSDFLRMAMNNAKPAKLRALSKACSGS